MCVFFFLGAQRVKSTARTKHLTKYWQDICTVRACKIRARARVFPLASAAGVQDALLSPPALEESLAWEETSPFGVLSVDDVIQPVSRAAQAAAKKR